MENGTFFGEIRDPVKRTNKNRANKNAESEDSTLSFHVRRSETKSCIRTEGPS